jgi:DNA-binding SARP family transcriptional activator/pimeloyl-ACP methyl ester carboxylesterase
MLGLLGTPTIIADGESVPLMMRPKALALLAYLALAGHPVKRHLLADLFFPTAEDPRATLRWHLSHFRAAAPTVANHLKATRDTVTLSIPTDVALFRRAADRVSRFPDADDTSAVLGLYRGDFLAGLAVSAGAEFDDWLYVEQDALRCLFRRAAVAHARWALTAHRAEAAVSPLSRLTSVDPYFEDGHTLLIEAYTQLGERDRAALAYDRYQRMMRLEVRAEPRTEIAQRFESEDAPVDTRPFPNDELVPLSQVTIHVVDWPGDAPAILGIHGSGMSAYSMTALAERLAPDIRFTALDLRGHGFSDKPPRGYDLECHVSDVRELIDALDLRRPLLLGHSAGGTVAAFVASQVEASGLILLEGMIGDRAFTENAAERCSVPIGDWLDRRFAGFDAYQQARRERARRTARRDDAEYVADRWLHVSLAPLADGTYRQRALRRAVEEEWATIVAADSLGALRRVRCPVLIVQAMLPWLDGLPYFTDAIVAAQMQAAPNAESYIARNSDHGTLVGDPEQEFIATLRRFVARCARQPRSDVEQAM